MFSDNNRFLGFLIAISIPFGMYQVIKNFRGLPGSTTVIEATKDLSDFAKPFFKSDNELDSRPTRGSRFNVPQTSNRIFVAKADATPGSFAFQADAKTKKTEVAKKDAEKDKKKKKKKEDDKKKKTEVARPFYKIEKPRPTPVVQEPVYSYPGTYFTPVAAQKEDDEKALDADEAYRKWAALVLNQPSFKQVTEFISAFQNGQIPSEAYYKIVSEMISDSNTQMMGWGVMASTAVPSFESYSFLMSVIDGNTGTPAAQQLARNQLETVYQKINQLGVLRAVLQSGGSEDGLVYAANFVTQLANQHLNAPAQAETDQPENERAVANTTANFSSLIPVLEPLTRHRSRDVADAADRALSTIKAKLPPQQAAVE